MSVVSITVPSIGFPPAAGASKLIDLTDVEAGAAGSKIGQFLTEIAPVAGARRFGFMAAAGGLKVADWDAGGAALPLDPAAIGGTLATIDGIATVASFNPVPVMAGAASFYGLTMPIGLPAVSAALDLNWPLLPSDAPSFIFTLLHDQSADLAALVEAVLTNSAAGVSGLIAGLQSGNGFGFILPSKDSFPLTLPELGSSILLTINNDGSLVFGGFADDILTDSAAANGYAISYLMVVMGVSESLPPLSVNIGTSDLSGGYGAAELPDNVSDLDTIYRVTNGGIYAGQTLNQNDHVIFYNDQADFLIIRLPADFNPADVADLVAAAIAASVQAGGVVDSAIDAKLNRSVASGGVVEHAIDAKLNQSVASGGVVEHAIDAKLNQSVASGGVVDGAINTKLNQSVASGGVVDGAINTKLNQSVASGGVVDTAIMAKKLTGLSVPATKTEIQPTDNFLQAFGKLQASINQSATSKSIALDTSRLPLGSHSNTVKLLSIDGLFFLAGAFGRSEPVTGGYQDIVLFDSNIDGFAFYEPISSGLAVNIIIDDPLSILTFGSVSDAKIVVSKDAGNNKITVRLQCNFASSAGSSNFRFNSRIAFGRWV